MVQGLLWRWAAAFPPTLTGVSIAGFWLISALEDRADRARISDCLHNPATAQWSHGHGAWLPIAVLTGVVLGAVLSVVVILSDAPSPRWARAICYPTLAIALLALLPAVRAVDDYFAFPGGDLASLNGPPCHLVLPHPGGAP